ncbi:MAG TPA: hypothetical protein DCZ94_10315 [Lentisphaeria bacterium]|nr:MAG: hypothetical protein A2X48_23845 [Lentisphaerae bacterium GWF2_49_21]HBC87338.1 hypothetical protein [Lentisphaeria bacterium]
MKNKSGIIKEQCLIGYDNAINFIPYYTSDVWSNDGKYFIFYCQKDGRISLNRYFSDDGRCEEVLDMGKWSSSYRAKNDPYADMVVSGHVRNTETVLVPFDNRICHISIPGKSSRFSKAVFPDDSELAGPFHVSDDGKYLAGVNYRRTDAKLEKTSIFVYDIGKEKILFLEEIDFWANHTQFFSNAEHILFCHEGPTETIPARLHLLEWRKGVHYPIYPQKHNSKGELVEFVGHEMPAGDKVVAVRYPVSRMEDFGIILVDPETKTGEFIDHDDYLHVASNAAGSLFVMDTCWWGNTKRKTEDQSDIFLYDNRTKKKHFLASVCCSMKNQIYHVHPRLNRAGDIVLATAKESVDLPNAKILYLELAV